jgi:hypothetical protein
VIRLVSRSGLLEILVSVGTDFVRSTPPLFFFLKSWPLMIGYSNKFVFVHIYNTGGTSMRYLLREASDEPLAIQRAINSIRGRLRRRELHQLSPQLWKHSGALEYKMFMGGEWSKFFKFSIVRNPFDWQVSIYEYIKQTPDHYLHKFCSNISFLEYLGSQVCESMRPQTDFLYDEGGRCQVDKVVNLESINLELPTILSQLKLRPEPIPRLNTTRREKLSDYYCDDAALIVRRRFEKDFLNFGYSMDIPVATNVLS